ncbi:hypothetical protein [Streptomyces sp. V1I1]|uniref:hypothetical protein n=1 Tax=Streptomyces sp. V1I1 TaxID=3042272 RepID=UPI00278B3511|nr:hypothetical protein [Streptomyces sp. V1I1]MDQ0940512.1 putative transposase [Streptomyces sp. V1I1]
MKLVVQVKLLPSPEQAAALEATLRACNRAATYVSSVAFDSGVKDRNGLQKLLYADIKATFGLSAQPVVRVVHARRGHSSPCPSPPRRSRVRGDATRDRPAVGDSRERDKV